MNLEAIKPEKKIWICLLSGFVVLKLIPSPLTIPFLAQKVRSSRPRPTLVNYTATREDLLTPARELFAVVKSGAVKIKIKQTYPLREAAQAHADLESRKTTGSTVLLP